MSIQADTAVINHVSVTWKSFWSILPKLFTDNPPQCDTWNNTLVKIIYLPDHEVFCSERCFWGSDIDTAFIIQTTKSAIAIVHRWLVIKSISHTISHPYRISKLSLPTPASSSVCRESSVHWCQCHHPSLLAITWYFVHQSLMLTWPRPAG